MWAFSIVCATLVFCAFTSTAIASAQKRIALVLGNSAYVHAPKLENPANDAGDLAAVLRKMNFEVTLGRDLDKTSMDRTIRNFAESLSGAHLALVFYAGHGLQVSGQNYLIPIDAKLNSAAALDFETVRLDVVQRSMERGTMTNILILDACRDNPLSRNLARALGTRSSSLGKGLAPMESGEGTLISFSTQPGNVALDGSGRNSPFASALLKHMAVPGDDLPTILINVRNDVMAATGRKQVPWEHSALTAKIYFIPPSATQSPSQTGTHEQQVELSFWSSVKDSTSPIVLQTYLDRYPSGDFAPIARALIDHYEQHAKAAVAAQDRETKQREEARRTEDLARLEKELRAREAALSEARVRAESAKNDADVKRIESKARAEHAARAEQLRKAQEEASRAIHAAKAAEEKRAAAEKAAEEATKTAERAIASKKENAKPGEEIKVAALPVLAKPLVPSASRDGIWVVTWRGTVGQCNGMSGTYKLTVANGLISADGKKGTLTNDGSGTWSFINKNGRTVSYIGTFGPGGGRGRWEHSSCSGTYSATKM